MEIFQRAKAAIRALKGVPEIEERLEPEAFGVTEVKPITDISRKKLSSCIEALS